MKNKFIRTLVIIFAVIIVAATFSINFLVDIQWFKEVNYLSVYFTKLVSVLKLLVPVFIVIFITIAIYYRSIVPRIRKYGNDTVTSKDSIKRGNRAFYVIDFIIALIISIAFSSRYWYEIVEFTNATPFGVTDPIFGKDISFFVFQLPLIESLYNTIMSVLVFLVIATLICFIGLNAKDKLEGKIDRSSLKDLSSGITKFAGKQLAILTSLIMIMVSVGYLIKAWNLSYSPRGVVYGASYTDVAISLKFYRVITFAALLAAVVVFISILMKKVKPVVLSIVVLACLGIGENVAAVVTQQFVVNSNEKTLEAPYIEEHIEATKQAYNIDEIEEMQFELEDNLTAEDITNNNEIISNIKVNSYRPALEFFNQFQYIRYYYDFYDIDVDRYYLDGEYNQVFIAAREIDFDKLDENSISWQNKYLSYTHGYGVVMSKVNSVTAEGQPNFIMSNIPIDNQTDISIDNPRIYFGEQTNDYSIVNTKLGEIDYPDGSGNVSNNYDGQAGINMNLLNRILFALKEQNSKFLLSKDITPESKILINRNIVDRVNKIAPFLSYDSDPYVVVSNDKLYWIIDAYTTTNKYPFSQPVNGVNYVRNSVKVVIDAYDGTTDFYITDQNDPIAATYGKIFPELFKDVNTLSDDLRAHFKYPQDLFELQCKVLENYHVSDPGVFYNGDDVWSVSVDSDSVDSTESNEYSEATYVTMKLDDSSEEEMVILQYFNTKGRDNMVSMYGVRMDGDNYGKMFLYKFPTGGTVYSPMLFNKKVKQDPEISKQLSLWDTSGSEVQFGEVLIIPIENSLLYVEPLYLRASGENSIPEMKNVIVGYGDKIVLETDINKAIAKLFNMSQSDENGSLQPEGGTVSGDINPQDAAAIQEAYNKAIEAQKQGNWAEYGEYINKLGDLINNLNK